MVEFLIFATLLALSALASGSETAFFSLREGEIRVMVNDGVAGAKAIERLRKDPQRLLVSILLLNNIVNTSLASYATIVATNSFGNAGAGIATGLVTLLVLVFGEVLPKTFAISYRRIIARTVAPFWLFATTVLSPIGSALVWLEKKILKNEGVSPQALISEEEVRATAALGLEHGEIDELEMKMIERVFHFDDIPAQEIMTPLSEMEYLDGEVEIKSIAHGAAHLGYSRYPVYVGNEKSYIGYVHILDIMRALNSDRRDEELKEFVTPIPKVPGSTKAEKVFADMTRSHTHIALVTDDREGAVIGLVTLEDVIEVIVGNIEDEGDLRDEQEAILK